MRSLLRRLNITISSIRFKNSGRNLLLSSCSIVDCKASSSSGLDSKITSNEIEQAKEDLRKSVIDKYNSIKKLEIAYENTNLKLKELEEKKRILEVAIQAGTAIEQDYNDLLLGINEVNNGIDKIESQHALLVEMYNNPLLAGGSIN